MYATNTNERARKREEEHPHVCEEDQSFLPSARMPFVTSPHTWGRPDEPRYFLGRQRDIPTYVGKTEANEIRDRRSGNIPTYVGKTLKMLSKIRHLTFRKVPNLVTFKSHPEPSEKFRIPFLSFIRLSKRFVPPNFCRLERPLYNT